MRSQRDNAGLDPRNTLRHTVADRLISVRLDDEAAAALRLLEATGLTRSEAVRHALVHAAREHTRREALAAEAAALGADEHDLREKAAISAALDEISEPW